MRITLILGLIAAAGCSEPTNGGSDDLGRPRDMAGVRDLASGGNDLAMAGGDLAGAGDMSVGKNDLGGADLAAGDLNKSGDLSLSGGDGGGKDASAVDLAGIDLSGATDLGIMVDLGLTSDSGGGMDAAMTADLSSIPDMSILRPLVGGGVHLFGVTSDGYAIYGDLKTMSLDAVPTNGAAKPQVIDANYTLDDVFVDGKVVFLWQNVSNNGVGKLLVWTAAAGVKTAAAASIDAIASARPDGVLITFTSNANNAGTTADLTGATSDLVTAKKLVMGVGADPNVCQPVLAFAAMRAVAGTCAGAVAATGTISTWDANWTKVDLIMNAQPSYSTNDSGKLLARDNAANLSVFALTGGAGTKIDVNVAFAVLSTDGSTAIYRDTSVAGALWRSPTVNPAPLKLVAMNVHALDGLSPDSKQILFTNMIDQNTGGQDLYLAGTTAAAAPTTLDATADTAPGLFGDQFSADSSHVLYATAVDFANTFTGTLFTKPVGGGAATQQGTNVWLALATLGSKLVFNDNYTDPGINGVEPRADLKLVDSAGGVATLLHAQADVDIFVTFDKKQVVFADNVSMASAGLYVLTLP